MLVGKVITEKLEIIPTANMGFIVKFGERGRLAFESEDTLLGGLRAYLGDPGLWRPMGRKTREEER